MEAGVSRSKRAGRGVTYDSDEEWEEVREHRSNLTSQERERERKEARKKEIEEEMAGDLDRQWQELNEQRQRRAEVSVNR